MHIMYLLWKRWSRVGSLWDGSLGRKVIVRRVHDQLSQLQHQDFQHRCAIFLKKKNIRSHCEFGGHFPHHRYPFCQHFDEEPTAATSGFSRQMCNISKNVVSLGVFFISVILTKVQNLLPCTIQG